MPVSHEIAVSLAQKMSDVRSTGAGLKWARPDGKVQVTMDYEKKEDGILIRVY